MRNVRKFLIVEKYGFVILHTKIRTETSSQWYVLGICRQKMGNKYIRKYLPLARSIAFISRFYLDRIMSFYLDQIVKTKRVVYHRVIGVQMTINKSGGSSREYIISEKFRSHFVKVSAMSSSTKLHTTHIQLLSSHWFGS